MHCLHVKKKGDFFQWQFWKMYRIVPYIWCLELKFSLKLKLVGKFFIICELTLLQNFESSGYLFLAMVVLK